MFIFIFGSFMVELVYLRFWKPEYFIKTRMLSPAPMDFFFLFVTQGMGVEEGSSLSGFAMHESFLSSPFCSAKIFYTPVFMLPPIF